ncbi:MAG: CYTH domain-containing protein [Anaerolineales bacterium]|nr:CYTH domain-containing protein [Anaerolineales bacterium]
MGIEIERKFLLSDDGWRPGPAGVPYRQGYLMADGGLTVRVRRAGEHGYLTIKGPASGPERPEFEYEIPVVDADAMLANLVRGGLVDKLRYRRLYHGLVWEVDEFLGDNAGLIVAEVELERADQPVTLPPWVGAEVTADRRYTNAALSRHPFRSWGESANRDN